MLFLFARMARSYKTNSMPKGIGRMLEPIILYIRDDIAIQISGRSIIRNT